MWFIAAAAGLAFALNVRALLRDDVPPVWGSALASLCLAVYGILRATGQSGTAAWTALVLAIVAIYWQLFVYRVYARKDHRPAQ